MHALHELESRTRTIGKDVYYQIDKEDVALSEDALRLIRMAAEKVLSRYVPYDRLRDLSLAEAIHFFTDKMFWSEKTGGLLLCATINEEVCCLPIAGDQWETRIESSLN